MGIAFSPDGGRLVSTARDNKIILWNVSDPQSVEQIRMLEPRGFSMGIAFSPDGTRIAAGSNDNIILWDANSGREINNLLLTQLGFTACSSVPTARDWRPVATTSWSSCGTRDRAKESRSSPVIRSACMSVAFSPDGSSLGIREP